MSPPNSELYSIINTHMQPNMLCQASHNPVSFLLFIFWDITHYTTQAAQPCLEHKQCTLHINLSMVKPMQRNHIAPLYMLTPAYTSVKPTRTMVPTQSQCHYNTLTKPTHVNIHHKEAIQPVTVQNTLISSCHASFILIGLCDWHGFKMPPHVARHLKDRTKLPTERTRCPHQ